MTRAGLVLVFAIVAAPASALEHARVLDGDTLSLRNGERVRLSALNAPERAHRARCPRERALAEAAADLLADLVADGVEIEPEGRDRYGRLLATVRDARGHDVADEMIVSGLAARWRRRGPQVRWCEPGEVR